MIELIGYHGTVKTSAEKILSSKEFIESNNDNEWLGHGIYFFADIENAIKWASERAKRYKEPAIILSADIKCNPDKYLDLDYKANRDKVSSFMKDILEKTGKELSFHKRDEEKRCIALNLYKEMFNIDVMEFSFARKIKKGNSSDRDLLGLSSIPEKQICVSNHLCLSNIKIVRGDEYVERI